MSTGKEAKVNLREITEEEEKQYPISTEADQPLTQQKVREMTPDLEFYESSEGSKAYTWECPSSFGTYEIVKNLGEWDCTLHNYDENVPLVAPINFEEAKQICQKDFEGRVLRCLGFEPEKEE
jgi:hypothetical protein